MMRIYSKILFLIIVISCTFLPLTAHADDGILAGSFLRMGLGARALGMGNAFTGMAIGPEAVYYNPGAIPFIQGKQVIASYRFLSLDRHFNYIGYSQDISPKVDADSQEKPFKGGLAISWIYAGVDHIDGRGLNGQHIGDFSNAEHAFMLTFGLSPFKFIGVGMTAKVIYNRLPNMKTDDSALSENTVGLDLGVLIKPVSFLSIGFMIKDLNAKYDWKTDDVWDKDIDKIDRFPTTYRGGIAITYPYQWLTLAFDVEKNEEQNEKLFVGLEAVPISQIAARVGLNDGNFAAGAGYNFHILKRQAQIQYALVTKDYDVASEHIFSWIFKF